MSLPKTITINGLVWTIRIGPCDTQGHFSCKDRIISIDDGVDEDRQMEILQHELLEACMVESGVTYKPYPYGPGDTDSLFVMTHRQFASISKVFYDVMSQLYGKRSN